MTAAKKSPAVKGITVPPHAQLLPIKSIKPFDDNPRIHPPEQVKALAAMILKVGFLNPVIVDAKNNLISGHGRILAAKSLGMDRVPIMLVTHLTEQQRYAYIIADNKLAAMATWEPGNLSMLLEKIKPEFPNLAEVGFSAEELRRLKDDLAERALPEPHEGDHEEEMESSGEPSSTEEGGDEEDLLPFSVLLKADDREEVYRVIRQAKDRDKTNNTAAALLTIIREWKP